MPPAYNLHQQSFKHDLQWTNYRLKDVHVDQNYSEVYDMYFLQNNRFHNKFGNLNTLLRGKRFL